MTVTGREDDVAEWFNSVMDSYHERWRETVANEVTDRMIDTIPEAERTPAVLTAIGDTALAALGLKPLPEVQGEQ